MFNVIGSVLLFFVVTFLFAQDPFQNNETGWTIEQGSLQCFYIFPSITINGLNGIGDGSGPNEIFSNDGSYCYDNPFQCDVIGAFHDDNCVGWVYMDSTGETTVPAVAVGLELGDIISFKVYDSSEDNYIDFSVGYNADIDDYLFCYSTPSMQESDCTWENNSIYLMGSNFSLDNEEIPSNFTLLSAYPNPFNPSVNISFYIESNSLIDLKIYDMLGGLVDTLALNTFMASGDHSAIWTPDSNISTGEYIISLSIDGTQKATQKIAYIK